mgnify:CR=1 FL=1
MTLVILSKDSFEDMYKIICSIFEQIPNYSDDINKYTFNKIL